MNRKVVTIVVILLVAVLGLLFFLSGQDQVTIQYRDKNSNGVWDDVEPFIESTAKTERQKKALEFKVKFYQKVLLDPSIGLKERDGQRSDLTRSNACIYKTWGGFRESPDSDLIKEAVLTSRPRIEAWFKYNANSSGGVYSLWNEQTDGEPCPF